MGFRNGDVTGAFSFAVGLLSIRRECALSADNRLGACSFLLASFPLNPFGRQVQGLELIQERWQAALKKRHKTRQVTGQPDALLCSLEPSDALTAVSADGRLLVQCARFAGRGSQNDVEARICVGAPEFFRQSGLVRARDSVRLSANFGQQEPTWASDFRSGSNCLD